VIVENVLMLYIYKHNYIGDKTGYYAPLKPHRVPFHPVYSEVGWWKGVVNLSQHNMSMIVQFLTICENNACRNHKSF